MISGANVNLVGAVTLVADAWAVGTGLNPVPLPVSTGVLPGMVLVPAVEDILLPVDLIPAISVPDVMGIVVVRELFPVVIVLRPLSLGELVLAMVETLLLEMTETF